MFNRLILDSIPSHVRLSQAGKTPILSGQRRVDGALLALTQILAEIAANSSIPLDSTTCTETGRTPSISSDGTPVAQKEESER